MYRLASRGRGMNISEIDGIRVLDIDSTGPEIGSERSAVDLIGDTYGQDIHLIAIPLARLSPDFLNLRTSMAGHFLQKFINYGYRVAIVGDISAATLASRAGVTSSPSPTAVAASSSPVATRR